MPGQTGPKSITNRALKAALRKHAGVYVLAARDLGCSRDNIAQRVSRSPELQRLVKEIEEEIGDVAVGVIVDTLLDGRPQAQGERRRMARWYASTKLKHLGFTTRVEQTGPDGAPLANASPTVHINVSYVDAPSPGEDNEEEIL